MSTALHILVDRQNLVGWWLVVNYMQIPPTPIFLEFGEQVAYMEIHPQG